MAMDKAFDTIARLIREHARERPQHPALVLDGTSLGYAALDAAMDRVASALQREGVAPGETIAVCAATSLNYVTLFLGAVRAGVSVAPLAPDTPAEGLAAMVADAGAKLFFLDAAVADAMQAVAGRLSAPRIALDDSKSGAAYSDWLAPPGSLPAEVSLGPDSPFNIIYSSGTTGTPKGIAQPHGFRWAQVQMFASLGHGQEAVTLASTPLYSNTTLSSILPALSLGGSVVLMAKFNAAGYLALAERHRATNTMLVPVQFQRLMAEPDFDRYDLSAFRLKSCTTAPFPRALKAEVLARWPGRLIEYYGMTEGGGVCILEAERHPDKLHTVGRPAPGHDLRTIDEAGRELPRGEPGEIVGRSGTMMVGYHGQPEKTAAAEWFDDQGQRFLRTGDIGRFDEEGFLVLLDRKKDLIISGGFNIYPSDLEAVLREHREVAEVAVVGVNSARWGETPVAFVVAKSGTVPKAETLLAWANGRVGKSQRLASVEIVASLPRSGIGKVLKRQLRDAYNAAAH